MDISGSYVFRDFEADGIPSSGKHNIKKSDARQWTRRIESTVSAIVTAGGKLYNSRAAMNADLTPAANTSALVIGDPTAANNGLYMKVGAAGSGSWIRLADVPGYQFVSADNTGSGNENAIVATSALPITSDTLISLPILSNNTASPVTVSFNGEPTLTIKTVSGNDPVPGGLLGGMVALGVVSGSTFRLISDQASSAVLAAAEAAADRAELAAASVDLPPLTPNTMLVDNPAGTERESKSFKDILEIIEIDRNPISLPQNPVYTPSSSISFTSLLINGNTENGGSPVYHRHFGSIAVDHRGIIHLVYRRALGHAGYFPGVICYMTLDHNGNERSGEAVLMEPALPDGRDLHSPMLTVLPNGRMIMTFTELNTSGSGSACLFKCMHTDDYGTTWSSPVTFANMLAARTFGQPRVVPSNVAGERYMLLQPWYGPGLVGARRIGLYESHDNGVTWTDRTVPIYEGADMDLNETSIAVLNARVWFAACRHNSGFINWFVTTDAGQTWTAPVAATWGTSGWDVAPSLDVVCVDGVDYVVVGYCDRNSNQTKWRWAKASTLMANPESMGGLVAVTSAPDMISSSGYQIPVIYPNGQMLFVEFREYVYGGGGISDPVGSDVRFVWTSPAEWITGRPFTWSPTIVGVTTAGAPVYGSVSGLVSKETSGKVTINLRVTLTSKGGMAGNLRINNLPFRIKNGSTAQPALSIGFMGGVALGTATAVTGIGVFNSRNLDLYKLVPASGYTALLAADVTDSFTFYGTLTYFTDE